MLAEARRRQDTCSNDTAYVGSRPPFSARAGKSVHGEPRSADEREGVLRRFSSIVCCVGIAVALLLPQIHGEQQQQRLPVVLPFQRASRTAHGQAAWSNQAEHGRMACRIEITCGSVSRSSHGERWRPVEAVFRVEKAGNRVWSEEQA